ncbi:MAG: efflux RND transporter periplasmic adaptor subunit [Magnetococcales bacterium]|nr:efflux RND transporter periplasmic adaptor subunit [Magnetococcales bacterium]
MAGWLATVVRGTITLAILAAGGAGALHLMKQKAPRSTKSSVTSTTYVTVDTVTPTTLRREYSVSGLVEPVTRVTLSAEVTGRILFMSEALRSGGRFRKGEVLVRLDSRSYRLEAQRLKSVLERAEHSLEIEKGRQKVAQRDWKMLKKSRPGTAATDLALRKPHLAVAETDVQQARMQWRRATLDVERCTIKAPFSGMTVSRLIDVGAIARPGEALASLIGSESVRIAAQLDPEQIPDLAIPGWTVDLKTPGAKVEVHYRGAGGKSAMRHGLVRGLKPELDPSTRRATLWIHVHDPLSSDTTTPPLLPGTFVTTSFAGSAEVHGLRLPTAALGTGDAYWTLEKNGTLQRHPASVLWRTPRHTIISMEGTAPQQIVTSPLLAAVSGQRAEILPEEPHPSSSDVQPATADSKSSSSDKQPATAETKSSDSTPSSTENDAP